MTRERVALTKLRLKLYLLAEPSAKNIRHLGPALLTVTKPPFCLLGSLLGASAGSQNDVTFAIQPHPPLCAECDRDREMAAVVIPGQPRRWGNESTNFFQHSSTEAPGLASRQKVYRCDGNQYTNCGHYHLGTKAVNL